MQETLETLAAKRDELELKRMSLEVAQLERDAMFVESERHWLNLLNEHQPSQLNALEGDFAATFVDPATPYYDTPGFYSGSSMGAGMTRPTDREDYAEGDYRPFWHGLTEHRILQGVSRYLGVANHHGISLVEGLADYAVYTGYTHTCEPKDKQDDSERTETIIKECRQVLREFDEQNRWRCCWEGEIFQQSRFWGEYFIRVIDNKDGTATVREIPAFSLAQPLPQYIERLEVFWNLPASSWSYGVVTPEENTGDPLGYFVEYDNTGRNYEFVPADEVVPIKLNVPHQVKRGLSDFYPVFRMIQIMPQAWFNLMVQSGIQASIAYIQSTDPKMGGTVASLGKSTEIRSRGLRGEETIEANMQRPGQIIHAKGVKHEAGPVGNSNGPDLAKVLETGYRLVGMRYRMPEYMSSGNPSTSNRATADSSEQPFVKSTERKQVIYSLAFEDVDRRVLAIAIKYGRFAQFGIYTIEQLFDVIDLSVTGPDPGTRKVAEEISEDKALVEMRVKSRQTVAEKHGLDWQKEKRRIEEEDAEAIEREEARIKLQADQPAAPGENGPGSSPAPPRESQESLREQAANLLFQDYP